LLFTEKKARLTPISIDDLVSSFLQVASKVHSLYQTGITMAAATFLGDRNKAAKENVIFWQ